MTNVVFTIFSILLKTEYYFYFNYYKSLLSFILRFLQVPISIEIWGIIENYFPN